MTRAMQHSHETVLAAFQMRSNGVSDRRVAAELGVADRTVRNWFSEPSYDPHIDEVAVERALSGDLVALDGLTVWERHMFDDQLGTLAAQWEDEKSSPTVKSEGHYRFGERWPVLLDVAKRRRRRHGSA